MILNDYFFFYFLLFPSPLAIMHWHIFILKYLKHIPTNRPINGNLQAASHTHTLSSSQINVLHFG